MFSESSDWEMGGGEGRLCESCGEEPASVHVTRIENGSVTHTHLCQSCTEELGEQSDGTALMFAVPASLGRMFTNLIEKAADIQAGESLSSALICGACGTSLSDLRESGLVGCADCYRVFAEHLETAPGLPEEQAGAGHLGKVPSRPEGRDFGQLEVLRLQRMLRELVQHERFEEAASVRDRLTELEG